MAAFAGARGSGAERNSVNWERAWRTVSGYRTPVGTSGLVEVDSRMIVPDPEDLAGICRARGEAIGRTREEGAKALRALGEWRDPVTDEQRAGIERLLGDVAGYEGDIARAIRHYEAARTALAPYAAEYPTLKAPLAALEEGLGALQMRKGERDNCMMNPGADRCLFPVRPGGRHRHAEGAEAALGLFRRSLQDAPDDLQMRWLVNVAAMLLGRHPQGLSKQEAIPPSALRSEAPMPRFLDVAQRAGLGGRDIAGGTIADDFDRDGLVDVVFSTVDACRPLRLFRNRGDGTFEDRTEPAGLAGQLGGLNAVQTDYNNDGWPDIFVMRGGWEFPMRNSLLRNNADGTFTDVTRAAGLSSAQHATHSAAWADYDNDGWLDLFVGHELTPSQLFRNRGDGSFEDATQRAGVGASAFTKGVAWGDYDKDGAPDLYVSNIWGENFLYHNDGNGRFTDVAARLQVQKPIASFPTWFFDFDNDAWLDIFVSSNVNSVAEFARHYVGSPTQAETLTLYRNNRDGSFQDVSARAGLARVVSAMGSNFGDLDNDGFLDMYLGTGAPSFAALVPNIMLRNDEGRRFLDVTEATGTGHLQKGHGVAFADVDNDGDQDVILNVGGAVPGDDYEDALFENPGGHGGNWISIRLVGVKTNRSAIGARILLRLAASGAGESLRYREVTSGGSFGASPLTQHVGLGKATRIDALEVEWPTSRTRQVFRDVPANRAVEIREFEDSYAVRSLPQVSASRLEKALQ